MIKKFHNNDKLYTWKDIKRANEKIVYWVCFPQGVNHFYKNYSTHSKMMIARNFNQAVKLYNKYNGAYIEKLVQCKLGRWSLHFYSNCDLPEYELWNSYATYPPINFEHRKK